MTAKRLLRLLAAVLIGGFLFKVTRAMRGPATSSFVPPPARTPEPTAARTARTEVERAAEPEREPSRTWVEPVDGACPVGHPVKAKLRSGIFHLPGMVAYERTNPDRCYPEASTAEADGLRIAKR